MARPGSEEVERKIVGTSILPDPEGRDEENEAITLVNTLESSIDLTGWTLKDEKNNDISLNGTIPPKGEITKIIGRKYPLLNNTGDTIRLHDAQGTLQDKQEYKTHLQAREPL